MSVFSAIDRIPITAQPALAAGAGALLFGGVAGLLSRSAEMVAVGATLGAGFVGFVGGAALLGSGTLAAAGVLDEPTEGAGRTAALAGFGYIGASIALSAGGVVWARSARKRSIRRGFARDLALLDKYNFDWM